jgi:putative ABC transport system permease protein
VVGVVANTIVQPMDPEIDPRIYVPYDQDPARSLTFTVRTQGAPQLIGGRVTETVLQFDPALAAEPARTGEERLRTALWPVRFFNRFAAGLAMLGLIVAAAGVFGLTQYLTLGRRREIAVRSALGAAPFAMARLIARQTSAPLALGIVVGLALSLGLSRVLQHLLPGVSAIDPYALVVAAVVLGAVGSSAVVLPATRAMRWDVAEALRRE